MGEILAVCPVRNGAPTPAAAEAASAALSLSGKAGMPVEAVAIGAGAASAAQALIDSGVGRVFAVDHPSLAEFNDELHAQAVEELFRSRKFAALIIHGSTVGRALAGRLGSRLGANLVADAFDLSFEGGAFKARRSFYSGNAVSTISVKTSPAIFLIQPMVYAPVEKKSGGRGEIVKTAFAPKSCGTEFVRREDGSSSEIDLVSAAKVVSGGRGLGNAEGFALIREFAATIQAAVGASRAAVDSGWIAYRHQVGLTGRTVHPKLYVACGISGQVQHLAGMSSSGTIVAVNTDPDCPMMRTASLSVVGDLYEIVPAVIAEIKRRRGG